MKFAASGSLFMYSDGGFPNPASILTDFSMEPFMSSAYGGEARNPFREVAMN